MWMEGRIGGGRGRRLEDVGRSGAPRRKGAKRWQRRRERKAICSLPNVPTFGWREREEEEKEEGGSALMGGQRKNICCKTCVEYHRRGKRAALARGGAGPKSGGMKAKVGEEITHLFWCISFFVHLP